jgi:hypothetical protein
MESKIGKKKLVCFVTDDVVGSTTPLEDAWIRRASWSFCRIFRALTLLSCCLVSSVIIILGWTGLPGPGCPPSHCSFREKYLNQADPHVIRTCHGSRLHATRRLFFCLSPRFHRQRHARACWVFRGRSNARCIYSHWDKTMVTMLQPRPRAQRALLSSVF